MRLTRRLLLCFILCCLPSTMAWPADEDESPLLPLISESNEPPVWWQYGRAESVTTYTRLGKTQRTYEYSDDVIIEKIWRAADSGEWLPLPDAVNTYSADFGRVLRAEYAFDEYGSPEEWREYDYDKRDRLMAIRMLRSRSGRPSEEINRIEFERDPEGRVIEVSRHENGSVFVEQRHRYEADSAGARHVIDMTYPEAKTMTTTYAGDRRAEYTETRGKTLLSRLRYDEADRPAEEWRYEDAEHYEHRQWIYRDGALLRIIQDFSHSSFPELGNTTYEYRYRYGRLSNHVKADAQRRALEKTVIIYVHEPVFDDGARGLPDDMAAWWHYRPARVMESLRLNGTEMQREYSLRWDEHNCFVRFSETEGNADSPTRQYDATYTRDGLLQTWHGADALSISQVANDTLPRRLTTQTEFGKQIGSGSILRTFNDDGNLATTIYQNGDATAVLEDAQYGVNDTGALVVIRHHLTGIEERRQSDTRGALQIVEWVHDGAVMQRLRCNADGLPAQMQWFTANGTAARVETYEYEQQRRVRGHLDVMLDIGDLPVGRYETAYDYQPDGVLLGLTQTDSSGVIWRRLRCEYNR